MTTIHSLEDLARAKEEALEKQRLIRQKYPFQIRIGTASCGIAVGALETLETINKIIEDQKIPGVRVIQTGCIGLCALEPIVEVEMPDQPTITYGKVTPEVARRILEEHIGNGIIVQEYLIESI